MAKYYYLSRPPGIGCQPDGDISREAWSPTKPIPPLPTQTVDDYRRPAHGFVLYAKPLSYYVAWKHDLLPAEETERLAWYLWIQGERDGASTMALLSSYLKIDPGTLAGFAGQDHIAALLQRLCDLGYRETIGELFTEERCG